MNRKEELESKKVSEIAEICKSKKIPHYVGRNRMTKAEMIGKILECEDIESDVKKTIEEAQEVPTATDVHLTVSCGKPKLVEEEHQLISKEERIANAAIGMLVAFHEPDSGKMNTAKIVNKSTKKKMFKLETQYGAEFIVPYENVVWVKTGTRWPKGIYNTLKKA